MLFRSSYVLPLAAAVALSCTAGDPDDKPADTDIAKDTDVPDTDVPDTDVKDTDVKDTDDTDVVETGDTTPIDTDTTGVLTTINAIRTNSGGFLAGDLLLIEGVTVVEVRSAPSGPRGFTVQQSGSTYAALWVDVTTGLLPAEGALVDVKGSYREFGSGAPPTGTQTQLRLGLAFPGTEWLQAGVSTRPAPIVLTPTAYNSNPEPYESMRVLLDESAQFVVTVAPRADNTFDVSPEGAGYSIKILPLFYNMPNDLRGLGVGDEFNAIAGTVWFDNTGYGLAPTLLTDGLAYVPYVPPVNDTDINDTDDTDDTNPPFDTDPPVIDTNDTDDNGPDLSQADIRKLRLGVYGVSTPTVPLIVSMQGAVVTAVRYRTTPVSSNAVAVQFTNYPDLVGIYLDEGSQSSLPTVGDVIDFSGKFVENSNNTAAAGIPYNTLAQVQVSTGGTAWTKVGTASRPTPIALTPDDVITPTTMEKYESMLVEVSDPNGLVVTSTASATLGFRATATGGGTQFTISPRFYDVSTTYGVNAGDTLASVVGVVYFEAGAYKIAPVALSDVHNYVDN